MKKYLSIFLIFLFWGLSYSGESPLPKIESGKYEIRQRKGKTFFVDFVYEVKIQGKAKIYDVWLQVILYDDESKEIESFGRQIKIKPKEFQIFSGKRMILIEIVKEIKQVGFDLWIYQKKY